MMTAASSLVTAFIVYLAALSPDKIFDSEKVGGALSVRLTPVTIDDSLDNRSSCGSGTSQLPSPGFCQSIERGKSK